MSSPIRERTLQAAINKHMKPNFTIARYASTRWQGNLDKLGDKVTFMEPSPTTMQDASVHTKLTMTENDPRSMQLEITDKKGFWESVDHAVMGNKVLPYIAAVGEDGAYGFANEIDKKIIATYGDAGIKDATRLGTNASAKTVDNTTYETFRNNVLNILSIMWEIQDKEGVPKAGRFYAMNPWIARALVNLETGNFIPALGYTVLSVPNMPTQTDMSDDAKGIILAGVQNKTFGYAQKVSTVKTYSPEGYDTTSIEGYCLYGAKLLRPDTCAIAYVK